MDAVVDWIRPQLSEIPREPPGWGICHADLVLSNVRAAAESGGVSLFDFGSVSRTYRGYDLAVVHWSLGHRDPARRPERWAALLEGYASIRPLPDRLEDRLPTFLALRELAFLGGNAATLPLRLGTEPFESSFMHDGFDRIRSILAEAGAIL
jgi:Ser/Thr protein kinase RdoA (MazF antagonist)